jgi:hypothetical protein
MRASRQIAVAATAVVLIAVLLWIRVVGRHRVHATQPAPAIPDRAVTSPLDLPGGEPVSDEAYVVYSSLYAIPMDEPLAFAERSVADIPQVNGSCLQPSTPEERAMTDAFVAANRQSHPWQAKFSITQGYRLLSQGETIEAQACLAAKDKSSERCASYAKIGHIRFLGVPGFNPAHTRALVEVIKMCGNDCGSGGIFVAEQSGGSWRRADATDFTRGCSWMY